jgi:hypothetical protein
MKRPMNHTDTTATTTATTTITAKTATTTKFYVVLSSICYMAMVVKMTVSITRLAL